MIVITITDDVRSYAGIYNSIFTIVVDNEKLLPGDKLAPSVDREQVVVVQALGKVHPKGYSYPVLLLKSDKTSYWPFDKGTELFWLGSSNYSEKATDWGKTLEKR